jgi:hypothetical protein
LVSADRLSLPSARKFAASSLEVAGVDAHSGAFHVCRKATDLGQEINMGNKKTNKRMRRAATMVAALGMLVMSSGLALMLSATSADAAPADKIVVCKYVSTPGGELDHIVVVSESTLPDEFSGSFPFAWTDAHGGGGGSIAVRPAAEGEQAKDVPLGDCPSGEEEPDLATASVTFTDPSCGNGNVASYATSGDNVTFDSPTAAAGAAITVTASATGGAEFSGGGTEATFDHTFSAAEVCDSVVEPPTGGVNPPKKPHTTTVTPTVVHAGLTGATVEDMRGEQGLALMFAGMLMLVVAGGLGMRLRGDATRI